MRFDFENAETVETFTGTLLPVGSFVVSITSADVGSSSNGHPQIELEVGNDQGSRKDWLVYGADRAGFGVRKVSTLFRCAGVDLSNDDQGEDGLLKDAAVKRLVGKKVGVVIREEDDSRDPSKKRIRIKGYVPVEAIGDVPAATATGTRTSRVADEDIPF